MTKKKNQDEGVWSSDDVFMIYKLYVFMPYDERGRVASYIPQT